MHEANHGYGFAPMGQQAIETGSFDPRQGIRGTLLLAADVNAGSLCWWVFPGSVNTGIYHAFVQLLLLPALAAEAARLGAAYARRYVMFDNLSCHGNGSILALFHAAGHVPLARPRHSPDFAFIESCFSASAPFRVLA